MNRRGVRRASYQCGIEGLRQIKQTFDADGLPAAPVEGVAKRNERFAEKQRLCA